MLGKDALNVLHISTCDTLGGAARAAYRLQAGLKSIGVTSHMLVARKYSRDNDVMTLQAGRRLLRWLDEDGSRFTNHFGLQYFGHLSTWRIPKQRWWQSADVVNLHNIHADPGFFSPLALPALSRNRPLIWTLHDMWPMTGHCAYNNECDRWQYGCGRCPQIDDYPAIKRDTTAFLWRIKRWVYGHSRLTIVAPSQWLVAKVRSSPLLSQFPVYHVPYGLDVSLFKPIDKQAARTVLDAPLDGRLILFGAADVSDSRKGGPLLQEALGRLHAQGICDVTLAIIGQGAASWQMHTHYPVLSLGSVQDDRLLATIYSAADVFVLPTRADNFPNSLLESMACATPCVSFSVGGVPEIVRHKETGYLAQAEDVEGLARGIAWLLDDAVRRHNIALRCRQVAEQEYALPIQARRYRDLYLTLLEQRGC